MKVRIRRYGWGRSAQVRKNDCKSVYAGERQKIKEKIKNLHGKIKCVACGLCVRLV